MTQSGQAVDGIIKITADGYNSLHFRIEPSQGKRLGYDDSLRDRIRRRLGLPSGSEIRLRKQLYAIPDQDSPGLWIPPRFMRKPYYEFTTRLMPSSVPHSSLMITRSIVEDQKLLAFELKVRRVIREAFEWHTYDVLVQGADGTFRSTTHSNDF